MQVQEDSVIFTNTNSTTKHIKLNWSAVVWPVSMVPLRTSSSITNKLLQMRMEWQIVPGVLSQYSVSWMRPEGIGGKEKEKSRILASHAESIQSNRQPIKLRSMCCRVWRTITVRMTPIPKKIPKPYKRWKGQRMEEKQEASCAYVNHPFTVDQPTEWSTKSPSRVNLSMSSIPMCMTMYTACWTPPFGMTPYCHCPLNQRRH